MKTIDTMPLPQASPGTRRWLTVLRYGARGSRPKAYLQAGLHAEEAPGYPVLQALIERLDRAERQGGIRGEIVVVPAANPIGLAQWRDETLQGRFEFATSVNFNRQHQNLIDRLLDTVGPRLAGDGAGNVAAIRQCSREILAGLRPEDEASHLKWLLLTLSHDADIVLDLHCDLQALLHLYLGTPLWPGATDLAAQMGAEATLLAADSGGGPFDEANSRPWWVLAEKFTEHPIPPACLAATVELRGICDTDQATAEGDADNLFHFLQRRRLLAGQAPPLPPLINPATPLTGVDYVKARAPGIIVYLKGPGDRVESGEVIARIVNPLPGEGLEPMVEVRSRTDGLLFTRTADRFARPGRIIAKIAGSVALAAEGNLLTP